MANNKIKGLTVEIGGDTTKLGAALENVNKKSRDLSSELGEINRMLKLDPGNTELLAQKQKVLADAVTNTKQKLDTLKRAEQQVQEQFERGEVSEEQYRALQREIIATEKKLSGYERAVQETAQQTENLGESLKDAGEEADGLGSILSGGLKAGLGAIAGLAAGAVAGLVGSAEATREYRQEMAKLDAAFTTNGWSAEAATQTYGALQGLLGETDQAVEAANHLTLLAQNEQDLAEWTDICTGIYAQFGASLPIEGLTEAANETAKVGAVTGPLADALNWAGISEDEFNAKLEACNSEQERAALITKTLSTEYDELAEHYKTNNAELIRANQANEAWASSLAQVGEVTEPLITDVKMLGASMLSDLVPGAQGVVEAFRGIVNGDEGAGGALGSALSGLVTGLLDKVVELVPTVANVASELVARLAQAILFRVPALLETIATVVSSVVTAVSEYLPSIISTVVTLIPRIIETLIGAVPQLLEAATTLLLAIVDAIPITVASLVEDLPGIIESIIDSLLAAFPILLDAAIQLLMAIVDAIPLIVDELTWSLPFIVAAVVDGLIKAAPQLLKAAVTFLMQVVKAVPSVSKSLVAAVPQLVTAVVDTLKSNVSKVFNVGTDLVKGLWNGINDKLGWLKKKLSSFATSTLDAIKDFFGVHSPSRETAWVGEMLDEGLAEGLDKYANLPIKAMANVSAGVLDTAQGMNGLTLERNIRTSYAATSAGSGTSVLGKLDAIYEAIKAGQVIALDGKQLVGATAGSYDAALGKTRALAARGA